ncbi:hypothetical protein LMG1861_05090 [Achromobacter piechaudii]|uniref:Uncharacterized protein n=2 Tax=Achromobacter piechaudii TaxID=72556 RepID=A0A6S7EKD8_9BURK|nr:hypothetical protein LMG1861_05090 [Achromobacter piechaudii]
MEDGAAQATLALLKIAKGIADTVVGDADLATVRAVLDRLSMETAVRAESEPTQTPSIKVHYSVI